MFANGSRWPERSARRKATVTISVPLASSADLKGGDANYNAAALRAVLEGKPGAFRNVALLNAAAALVVAGRAGDLKEGVALATQSLDSGAARKRLEHLVAVLRDGSPSILDAERGVGTMRVVDDIYRAAGLEPR